MELIEKGTLHGRVTKFLPTVMREHEEVRKKKDRRVTLRGQQRKTFLCSENSVNLSKTRM